MGWSVGVTTASAVLTANALAGCADEPIREPGAIQPYGVLLALGGPGLVADVASANAPALFGRDVVGVSIEALLDGGSAALVRAFSGGDFASLNPLRLRVVASTSTWSRIAQTVCSSRSGSPSRERGRPASGTAGCRRCCNACPPS